MFRILIAIFMVIGLAACNSSGQGEGALVGGAVGAATGAVVAAASGANTAGTLVGATVGAAGGAIIGSAVDNRNTATRCVDQYGTPVPCPPGYR